MIRINRGPEPATLAQVRATQLALLSSLGNPTSQDITGYRVVADDLWNAQHHKCCYCEHRIMKGFHDVEHYRPKASANREPGCVQRHGYWWLAFTWDNLLYACPGCNRSEKNDRFPLERGSISLMAPAAAPGGELPLLLDPGSAINPVEHIEFVLRSITPTGPKYWWARPRNGSIHGNMTIDICGLNRSDLLEVRKDYFNSVVAPQISALNTAIDDAQSATVQRELRRAEGMLTPGNAHVGLTYDALVASVPNQKLISIIGVGWPTPMNVPM